MIPRPSRCCAVPSSSPRTWARRVRPSTGPEPALVGDDPLAAITATQAGAGTLRDARDRAAPRISPLRHSSASTIGARPSTSSATRPPSGKRRSRCAPPSANAPRRLMRAPSTSSGLESKSTRKRMGSRAIFPMPFPTGSARDAMRAPAATSNSTPQCARSHSCCAQPTGVGSATASSISRWMAGGSRRRLFRANDPANSSSATMRSRWTA